MGTEVGKSGALSGPKGPWIEGDHQSIGTGGGAPPNGGDGKQSLQDPNKKYKSPVQDTNSGDQ